MNVKRSIATGHSLPWLRLPFENMRVKKSRIDPTIPADWDEETRSIMHGIEGPRDHVLNIFRTLAHHPKLLKRWSVFGNHVLARSTLPARERELIILRTGYLCGSGYEWAQHATIGRQAGLTDAEIERIGLGSGEAAGVTVGGWSADDGALLAATDQLVQTKFISEATWAQLGTRWDTQQLMDLVFTVGQYTLVSMALNTFGVQLESETAAFPAALFSNGLFPLPSERGQPC